MAGFVVTCPGLSDAAKLHAALQRVLDGEILAVASFPGPETLAVCCWLSGRNKEDPGMKGEHPEIEMSLFCEWEREAPTPQPSDPFRHLVFHRKDTDILALKAYTDALPEDDIARQYVAKRLARLEEAAQYAIKQEKKRLRALKKAEKKALDCP